MGYRKNILVPGQIYHVFNRTIAHEPLYLEKRDYSRFIDTVNFYRFDSPDLRFSHYNRLEKENKNNFIKNLQGKGQNLVSIFSFTLMPNHYHFVVKENLANGTKKFISNLQNSFAKYINTKNNRHGSLFQEMFKANRIETDEQFVHTNRYVHINPYTSFIVRNFTELQNYPWSSFGAYIGQNNFDFLEKEMLNSFYKSREDFLSFNYNQIDYQRKLDEIKHLILE